VTPAELTAAAARAAEVVRALNHQTRPGTAVLDATEVYDLLGELALMASRLPQLLGQIETLIDDLVEDNQVLIVDGPNTGDPAAVAAICGHWLAASAGSAHQLAHHVDQAHEVLAHAAATDAFTDPTGHRPSSS
jgi:hypothetical protein